MDDKNTFKERIKVQLKTVGGDFHFREVKNIIKNAYITQFGSRINLKVELALAVHLQW